MKITDRVCAATPDELFNLVIAVSSSSEHIAGMWTEKVPDGWIFTLKPWGQTGTLRKADPADAPGTSPGEGSLEIRRISVRPPQSRLICIAHSERAALFVEALIEQVDRHPAGGVSGVQAPSEEEEARDS